MVREALTKAEIAPGEVDYIEAHGTGTALGDPIEVMALADVLTEQRPTDATCSLGAVKSNIGHLEAAAGIASLIKTTLALKHGHIPPSLHFDRANPHIPFDRLPFKVQQTLTPWTQTSRLAKAGVSAFGFAGTNAHVVLEQAPAELPTSSPLSDIQLLPLSAHSLEALQGQAKTYQTWLEQQSSADFSLQDICYTASARRSHQKYRLAVVASSIDDLKQQLEQVADALPIKRRGPKVAFVFTDTGTQWLGMGKTLLQSEPVFRAVLKDCDALIRDCAGWSLLAELTADVSTSRLQTPAIAQPALFAIQLALAQLWRYWGVEPRAVVGHGLGEITAAHVAGRLKLRDAVALVCDRSQSDENRGSLKQEPILAPGKLPLFSTVAVDWLTESPLEIEHWEKTVTASGDLIASLGAVAEAGYATLLEISPTSQLQSTETITVLPSLSPDQPERATMLSTLGKLYVKGQSVNWDGLFPPDCRVVSLPLYAWQRERYWVEKTVETVTNPGHPLIAEPIPLALDETVFSAQLSLEQQPWLAGHQVAGLVVLPGAGYLEMALAAIQYPDQGSYGQDSYGLENISIETAMVLPQSGSRHVQMVVSSTGSFRIVSTDSLGTSNGQSSSTDWIQHAVGNLATTAKLTPSLTLAEAQARCTEPVEKAAYYQQLRSRGLEYGPSFQGIQQLWKHDNEALGQVQLPAGVPADAVYQLHPVLMDAGFQLLFATLPENGEETYLPIGLGQLSLAQPVRGPLWIHGKIYPAAAEQPIRQADLHLFDETGHCLAILNNLQVRRIRKETLQQLAQPSWQDWFYKVDWQPQPAMEPSGVIPANGHWLVLADGEGVGEALTQQLTQQGHSCTQIRAGETLQLEGSLWQVNPQRSEDWQQLFETVIRQSMPLAGVIHLWGADLPDPWETLTQTQQRVVHTGLTLAQGLGAALSGTGGKLWFVTRGTQAVETTVAQVGAAPLWGLGRVIALEQPAIWGGLVDLATAPSPVNEAQQLLPELLAPTGDAIAIRQQRHVARLTRATATSAEPLALTADATYLITGGLGSLGRQLAQHLIDHGAKHLVLLSRRSADGASLPTGPDVTVRVFQADVTQVDDLSRVITEIQTSLPPLRGVFHAAGLLDDALLAQQTPERFNRVMAPKVTGAWHLHQLTQDLSLDYFMLFSSVAAMLGSPGQANYAAANSFLDSLAYYRQGLGLPALSINWGTWAAGGMAAQLDEREQQRLLSMGLDMIEPDTGFQALDQLLQQPAAQVGVMPVRWEQFFSQTPTISPLLSALAPSLPLTRQAASGPSEVILALAELPAEERAAGLSEHLQDQLRKVLRLSPTHVFDLHQGFFDLGMDSLTSVELRNTLQTSLGQSLSSTLVFDYPTLDALAQHLAQILFPNQEPVPSAAPASSLTPASPLEDTVLSSDLSREAVEDLSEAEAEALLLEALEAI